MRTDNILHHASQFSMGGIFILLVFQIPVWRTKRLAQLAEFFPRQLLGSIIIAGKRDGVISILHTI